jgi:hypothetical protein
LLGQLNSYCQGTRNVVSRHVVVWSDPKPPVGVHESLFGGEYTGTDKPSPQAPPHPAGASIKVLVDVTNSYRTFGDTSEWALGFPSLTESVL